VRAARTTSNYIATPAQGQTASSEMWSIRAGVSYFLWNVILRQSAGRWIFEGFANPRFGIRIAFDLRGNQ
jgi:hypothetical protein